MSISAARSARRIVIGVTGATGSIYAVRMLEKLRPVVDVQTHLIISTAGVLNIRHELDIGCKAVHALADYVYNVRQVCASLASGAFDTTAMIIVPCSMRTLAAVAHGLSDNLITRAADVMLKERRRLVMMVRETPFNLAHLRNMIAVTEMGGVIFPPLPAFYHRPASVNEMIDHTILRVLGLVGISLPSPCWNGA